MNLKFDVKTTIDHEKGEILQELYSEMNNIVNVTQRQLFDTKEKELYEALVKLGWTPSPNFKSRNK